MSMRSPQMSKVALAVVVHVQLQRMGLLVDSQIPSLEDATPCQPPSGVSEQDAERPMGMLDGAGGASAGATTRANATSSRPRGQSLQGRSRSS